MQQVTATLSETAEQALFVFYPLALVATAVFIATRSRIRWPWIGALACGWVLIVMGQLVGSTPLAFGLYIGLVFAATVGVAVSRAHGWLRGGARSRIAGALLAVALATFFVQRLVEVNSDRTIEDLIEQALTSTDPQSCVELHTLAYLEQAYGVEGERAIAVCEGAVASEHDPATARVEDVEIAGDQATARLRGEGLQGGVVKTVQLVQGEGWLLDRTLGAEIDRPRFEDSYGRWLTSGTDALSPAEARCVISELGRFPTGRLEEATVDGQLSTQLFGSAVIACTRERLLADLELGWMPGQGKGRRGAAACLTAGLEELSDRGLAKLLYGDPLELQLRYIRCDRAAFVDEYRESLIAAEQLPTAQIDCYLKELGELSDRDLAVTVLSYSARDELSEVCA